MKTILGLGLIALLAGCASVTGPSANVAMRTPNTTTDFVVTMKQKNAPIAMPTAVNDDRAAAPIDIEYAISITNRTNDPVTVRHITLKYRDDSSRTVPRRTRNYEKTIAPGATEAVDFWVQMHGGDAGPYRPGLYPAEIQFDGPHGKRTESFLVYVQRPGSENGRS